MAKYLNEQPWLYTNEQPWLYTNEQPWLYTTCFMVFPNEFTSTKLCNLRTIALSFGRYGVTGHPQI